MDDMLGQTEPLAIASIVCACSVFVGFILVGSILGIVLGNMALRKIEQDPSLQGEQLARAGKIIGYVGLALVGLFVLGAMMLTCVATTASF